MLASDRTRRSASLIAPGHPATRPERRLDLLPVFEHCRHHIERPKHADGLSSMAKTMACSGGSVKLCVAGS